MTIPSFTSISRVNRTEQVREQLISAIEGGKFKPGDVLPSERALCEMFGVSRVSVREAIRGLEAVGLVTVQHGRGCFVAERRNDGYAEPFGHWLAIHREEVLDLLKVRGALEELAAQEAAQAQPQLIDEVKHAHEAFTASVADMDTSLERLVKLDLAFHEAIAEASGSQQPASLIRELNTHLAESRRITLAKRARRQQSAEQHNAIVQAILDRNPDEARAAAGRHVHAVNDAVVAYDSADAPDSRSASA